MSERLFWWQETRMYATHDAWNLAYDKTTAIFGVAWRVHFLMGAGGKTAENFVSWERFVP